MQRHMFTKISDCYLSSRQIADFVILTVCLKLKY